jgi:cytochrome c oxidase cbb3-type subunit III
VAYYNGAEIALLHNYKIAASRMRKLIYCVALLAVLRVAHGAEEHVGTYGEPDIERGARVYFNTCVVCHGPNGDSIPQVSLRSNHFNRAATDEELIRVINGGIPGTAMPANNLDGPDQIAIVAYIRNMDRRLSDAAAAGDATRGRVIFEGKGGCLKCHRVNGVGGRTAPDLSDIGLARTARALIQKLHDPASMILPANRSVRAVTRDGTLITGRRLNEDTWSVQLIDSHENLVGLKKADLKEYAVLETTPMPAYQGVLSDAEIGDVAGYLLSLKGLN